MSVIPSFSGSTTSSSRIMYDDLANAEVAHRVPQSQLLNALSISNRKPTRRDRAMVKNVPNGQQLTPEQRQKIGMHRIERAGCRRLPT
jgi:hypothetical protein